MDADYVLVFLTAQDIGSNSHETPLYVLGDGGDETKIFWFSQIAGLPVENFLNSDSRTPTQYFYENTMLGKMIPFTPLVYYQPETNENSQIYKNGFVAINSKEIKYDSDDDPLKLVYASPSFTNDNVGGQIFILVYQVNKNYISSSLD